MRIAGSQKLETSSALVCASAGLPPRTFSPTSTAVTRRPLRPDQLHGPRPAFPLGAHLNSYNRNGWFIGGGIKNNLNFSASARPAGS